MSKETKRLRLANYFMWITLIVWGVTLALWLYPRQTVEVTDFRTERTEYRVGEEIITTANGETFFSGQSNYDIRLLCDKGRYLLKSFSVTTQKSMLKQIRSSIGIVPVIPTPDWCVVRTQATHTVQILPFVTRTYTNVWETNRFLVEAER